MIIARWCLSIIFSFSIFLLPMNYISCADVVPDVTKKSQSKQISDLTDNIIQLAQHYKSAMVNVKYDLTKDSFDLYQKKAQEYVKNLQDLIPTQSQYRNSYLDTVLDSFNPTTFKRIIRNKNRKEEFFNSLKNIKNFGTEKFELTDIGDFGVIPTNGPAKSMTSSEQLDESARMLGSGLRKLKDIVSPTYTISDEYFDKAIKEVVSWPAKAIGEKITALQLLAACYYDRQAKQMKAGATTFNATIISQINKALYALQAPSLNASFVKVRETKSEQPRQVSRDYEVDYNYQIAHFGYISSKKINDLIQMGEGDVLRGFCALSGTYAEDIKSYKRNPSEIRKMEAVHVLQRYRQTFSICALRQKKFDTANVQKILKPLDEDIAHLKEKITEEYKSHPSKIKPRSRRGPRAAAIAASTGSTLTAGHIGGQEATSIPKDEFDILSAAWEGDDPELLKEVDLTREKPNSATPSAYVQSIQKDLEHLAQAIRDQKKSLDDPLSTANISIVPKDLRERINRLNQELPLISENRRDLLKKITKLADVDFFAKFIKSDDYEKSYNYQLLTRALDEFKRHQDYAGHPAMRGFEELTQSVTNTPLTRAATALIQAIDKTSLEQQVEKEIAMPATEYLPGEDLTGAQIIEPSHGPTASTATTTSAAATAMSTSIAPTIQLSSSVPSAATETPAVQVSPNTTPIVQSKPSAASAAIGISDAQQVPIPAPSTESSAKYHEYEEVPSVAGEAWPVLSANEPTGDYDIVQVYARQAMHGESTGLKHGSTHAADFARREKIAIEYEKDKEKFTTPVFTPTISGAPTASTATTTSVMPAATSGATSISTSPFAAIGALPAALPTGATAVTTEAPVIGIQQSDDNALNIQITNVPEEVQPPTVSVSKTDVTIPIEAGNILAKETQAQIKAFQTEFDSIKARLSSIKTVGDYKTNIQSIFDQLFKLKKDIGPSAISENDKANLYEKTTQLLAQARELDNKYTAREEAFEKHDPLVVDMTEKDLGKNIDNDRAAQENYPMKKPQSRLARIWAWIWGKK